MGKSARSQPCHRQGDSTTPGGSESPAVPLLSPSLARPPRCPLILGWSSALQDPPSHPKSAGSCPGAQVLRANASPGAGTRQVTPGDTGVPSPATAMSPTGPALAGSGHFKAIPREFQPWGCGTAGSGADPGSIQECGSEGTSGCACPSHSDTGAKAGGDRDENPPPSPRCRAHGAATKSPGKSQVTPRPPAGDRERPAGDKRPVISPGMRELFSRLIPRFPRIPAGAQRAPRGAFHSQIPVERRKIKQPPAPQTHSSTGNFPDGTPPIPLGFGQGHRARSRRQSGFSA